jgi:hypothetical protein
MFAAYLLSFFANAIFNMVMSRKLGVHDYGALVSLLAIFMVASVPLQTVQTVLMHMVARLAGTKDARSLSSLHGRAWLALGLLSLGVIGIGYGARLPLASFLHLRAPNWIFHLTLMILGVTAATLTKAFLQGLQRYTEMGLQITLDTMTRLALAVALVMAGVGVGGVLFAQVVSSWLGALLGLFFLSLCFKPLFTLRRSHLGAAFRGTGRFGDVLVRGVDLDRRGVRAALVPFGCGGAILRGGDGRPYLSARSVHVDRLYVPEGGLYAHSPRERPPPSQEDHRLDPLDRGPLHRDVRASESAHRETAFRRRIRNFGGLPALVCPRDGADGLQLGVGELSPGGRSFSIPLWYGRGHPGLWSRVDLLPFQPLPDDGGDRGDGVDAFRLECHDVAAFQRLMLGLDFQGL